MNEIVHRNKIGAFGRFLFQTIILPGLLLITFLAGTRYEEKVVTSPLDLIIRIRPSLTPGDPSANPTYWIRLKGSPDDHLWRPAISSDDRYESLQRQLDEAHERLRQLKDEEVEDE